MGSRRGSGHPIVLFDGLCNLCNATVDFIIRRDHAGRFRFASLQSEPGQELLRKHHLSPAHNSVVVIDGERAYTGSSAALSIARRLGGLWSILFALVLIPRPLRDGLYAVVARNRYRWFGKRDACRLPTPDLNARFLD